MYVAVTPRQLGGASVGIRNFHTPSDPCTILICDLRSGKKSSVLSVEISPPLERPAIVLGSNRSSARAENPDRTLSIAALDQEDQPRQGAA